VQQTSDWWQPGPRPPATGHRLAEAEAEAVQESGPGYLRQASNPGLVASPASIGRRSGPVLAGANRRFVYHRQCKINRCQPSPWNARRPAQPARDRAVGCGELGRSRDQNARRGNGVVWVEATFLPLKILTVFTAKQPYFQSTSRCKRCMNHPWCVRERKMAEVAYSSCVMPLGGRPLGV
jgi:hypothetical protein